MLTRGATILRTVHTGQDHRDRTVLTLRKQNEQNAETNQTARTTNVFCAFFGESFS